MLSTVELCIHICGVGIKYPPIRIVLENNHTMNSLFKVQQGELLEYSIPHNQSTLRIHSEHTHTDQLKLNKSFCAEYSEFLENTFRVIPLLFYNNSETKLQTLMKKFDNVKRCG